MMSVNGMNSSSKPLISISKNPSMADENISISISGLERKQKITLHGITTIQNGASFESYGHYVAGNNGFISLEKDESYGGTFIGKQPMGPLWSLVPSPINVRKHERFIIKDPAQPFTVYLRVYDSFVSLEDLRKKKGDFLCCVEVHRHYTAPGVTFEEIRVGRVRAYLYLPPGKGRFPGVISMSGGYPGAMKHKGSLLASRGFATLALKYFGEDDLPEDYMEIDLTYFEEAARYLQNHPRVYGENGVGIVANCYGATIALAFVSLSPPGLINCVVGINNWIHALGNFSYGSTKFPKPDPEDFKVIVEAKEGGSLKYLVMLPKVTDPRDHPFNYMLSKFHHRHDISYMFVFGDDDASIDVGNVSQLTQKLLHEEKHPNYKVLIYPQAGHLIEHAYCPLAKNTWTIGDIIHYGGQQPHHEKAQEESWKLILNFLHRNIQKKIQKL